MSENPTDWFQRHVLEKLDDLGDQQRMIAEVHQKNFETLARANAEHLEADAKSFAEIRQDIESLKPVKLLVYGFVGMVLAVVIGAMVATATGRAPHIP